MGRDHSKISVSAYIAGGARGHLPPTPWNFQIQVILPPLRLKFGYFYSTLPPWIQTLTQALKYLTCCVSIQFKVKYKIDSNRGTPYKQWGFQLMGSSCQIIKSTTQ